MRISSITLKNFRCFGDDAATILLGDINALIGNNGAGKTAVLVALSRLFGITQGERHIVPEDFHVPNGQERSELDKIELLIEVRIDFPELQNGAQDNLAIPQCFNQMIVSAPGEMPYCRVRLEASWTRSNLPEGDVEEAVHWITTPDAEVTDDHRVPMPAYARSMIHVLYVPAFRDAARQLSQVTGSLVYRLFRAIEWSDATRTTIKDSSDNIRKSVHDEASIKHIHACLSKAWTALHDLPNFKTVVFQPLGGALDQILRQVEAVFGPGHDGLAHPIDRLSDGLKSLFYFALVSSVFQVEETVKAQQARETAEEDQGEATPEAEPRTPRLPISFEELKPPALTLFAVEEPENHLAPHYLGRILKALEAIAKSDSGQVILTSHSPSILARIEPENVTYLRQDLTTNVSSARRIKLPKSTDEAFTFIKEAVRAFPELYFARLVIFGEGDSEEIVIPRLAKASKVDLDGSFVSVVPLGGRHVNHFWRLLRDLDIPHLTLLDLDREREGGGWGRIHYAIKQLLAIGMAKRDLLTITEGGKSRVLSDAEFEQMKEWPLEDGANLNGWAEAMEAHDVFFCAPLDIDFAMLESFPEAYHAAGGGKPHLPQKPGKEYDDRISRACIATLKAAASTGTTFGAAQKEAFVWYSYLFLGKGKPVTHMLALSQIKDEAFSKNAPAVLKRLVAKIKDFLKTDAAD